MSIDNWKIGRQVIRNMNLSRFNEGIPKEPVAGWHVVPERDFDGKPSTMLKARAWLAHSNKTAAYGRHGIYDDTRAFYQTIERAQLSNREIPPSRETNGGNQGDL